MNLVGEGEVNALGKTWSGVKAKETLQAALDAAGWKEPKRANVGRGIAMYERGTGAGKVWVNLTAELDGTLTVFTVAGDQGTGLQTILCQTVAAEMGVPYEKCVAASATLRTFPTASTSASAAAAQPILTAPRRIKRRRVAQKTRGASGADARLRRRSSRLQQRKICRQRRQSQGDDVRRSCEGDWRSGHRQRRHRNAAQRLVDFVCRAGGGSGSRSGNRPGEAVISFLRTTSGPLSIRSAIKVKSTARRSWRSARV